MPQRKKENKPLEKTSLSPAQVHALWYFERMDQVNRAMQGTDDLEQMMKNLLDTLLDIFDCDRAFLVYPCNPDHPTWQVPMERTRPEYPGVLPIGVNLPLDPVEAEVYRILRQTDGPVKFGIGEKYAVPIPMATAFNVQSFIAMAFYPKVGDAWSFGLHQCSHPRVWSSDEERLFLEIGRRLSDTLSTLLSYRSLRESESHIKHLIDVSPVAMVVSAGEEEKVISINGKFIELFGYTIEDMPDIAHWWPLAYPDAQYRDEVKAQWAEKVQKAIQTQSQIEPMEAQVTCKDGLVRYVEFQFSSIGDQHLVTFVDLTARKQAELALKEREHHSQSLLRLSRKLEHAQTYSDVLNAAQDEVREMIGYQNLWAYLITEDRRFAHAFFAKGPIEESVMSENGTATLSIQGDKMLEEIADAKEIVIVEDAQTDSRVNKEIVTALGNRTIVNVPIILFDRHLGSIGTGTFGDEGVRVPTSAEREYLIALASHMAVTLDRIHLLEKRKQTEQELIAREQAYRLLVENIPDLIVRYDKELRRAYVNPAWERSSQVSAAEAINRHPTDTPRIANSANKEYLEKLQQVLTTGASQSIEFKWVNALGETLLLEYFIVPEYDQSGKINGVLSVGRDITERKRMEETLAAREREFRTLAENSPDNIARYDIHGQTLYVNPTLEKTLKHTASEMLDTFPATAGFIKEASEYQEKIIEVIKTGKEQEIDLVLPDSEKRSRYHNVRFVAERGDDGTITGVLAIGRDITERKRMEEALSASEAELRALINSMTDLIFVGNAEGRFLKVVDTRPEHLYKQSRDLVGRTLHEVFPKDLADFFLGHLHESLADQKSVNFEYSLPIDEKLMWFYATVSPMSADKTLMVARDITELKLVENALRQSREATLHFSKQLTSLQEVINELSEARTADDLNRMAVETGRNLLEVDRMGIWFIDEKRKLMHGSFGIDEQGNLRDERNSTIELKEEGLAWSLLSNKKPMAQIEYHALQDDQNRKVGEGYSAQAALWDGDNVLGIVSVDNLFSGLPISEPQLDILQLYANSLGYLIKRKWAEEWLLNSEKKYRALAENIPNVVFQCKNNEKYTFIYLNNPIFELTGYSKEEFLEKGLSFFDLYHPEDRERIPKPSVMNQSSINHRPYHISYRIKHRSGEWRWVDEWGTGVINEKEEVEYIEGIMIDITSRKQYERERETIITVSAALRQATNRHEILSTILDQMIELLNAGGAFIAIPDSYNGGVLIEMGRGVIGNSYSGMKIPQGRGASGWVIANRLPYLNNQAQSDPIFYRPDMLGEYHCVAAVPLIAHEQSIGALWLARKTEIAEQDLKLLTAIADIAANAIHRITLHEQTEKQLNHLIALHQIDLAITTNFGLEDTLNIILGHVRTELNVDAASILLINEAENALEYAAGLGFKTEHIKLTHVKIGDGTAGRAALEKCTASSADLELASQNDSRSTLIAHEKFTCHVATPLLIKGQVKGILEVFHQTPQNPDSKWFDYFETLATQTMIAIENANLLKTLQVKNEELTVAYDATIEGWSRALDLRDHETEGHTQRVTEMALKLADLLGMSQTDKTDMRRGALLHDIGKMGVPDAILHKPGDLTETEWKVMREHPTLAYRMLSPIAYLNRALDISYYHHERWDGSGYPHGLKGEEIPLAARVFAIVDVFDALTSDRPYRKAWTYEKAYQYIELQAGKHFDPEIVKVFLANKLTI
jgi:PAS domain S-box-containing protein/putative nucleotidyltransferase with HDIG domain